ncbi:phage virion morphogenesis protein [Chromobacterium phragmitis]|uniref:phage virion morphogenesis protein n=1 Tax=Chromobacterium amazonense TaxID=1382803 RepID=UPI0021B737EC|nr:phage virion morphogenesis protein [Chromobacterium amazonense]MBM2883180.1 phage virion morphogenesis protein [Chromobacterium amazonense]MDE1716102.1 phage virion morphogenesis protein [Chromobacterium amazonense]
MTIARLESELSGLLHKVAPAARRALARDIGRALRQSQQKRIAAQQNPDGSGYAPRRPQYRQQKGRIRQQMFAKLRSAKWLKIEARAGGVEVGFLRGVERIARVHQYGLRDRISRHSHREAQYPARELLGLTEHDLEMIRAKVLDQLAK